MDVLSPIRTILLDHTFNVSAAAATVVTAFDADIGTLKDGVGTAVLNTANPPKYRWVMIINKDASYDLWVTMRNRSAGGTTLDPSSTRGFIISPKQTTPWMPLAPEVELRICNNSASGSPVNSAVHVVAAQ